MLTGPRPTDRSKDKLTVSRFSSQAENQPNLNVFLHTTEVVDPAPIRLVSSSLPSMRPLLKDIPGPSISPRIPNMWRVGP
jgi:hypothetical protein